jgi:hypothetical protein
VTGDGLCKHVVPNATHLGGVCREESASIQKTASRERHWIVPLIHDQHANDPFISIDDEVATELVHVFLGCD